MQGETQNVYKVYNKIGQWFDENRPKGLIMEKPYLDDMISTLPADASVLDLGCGTGKPMLQYLIHKNFKVTGVDASTKMLAMANANFPDVSFFLQDMRELNLNQKFDAIIAWHSFFHLPADDQPAMFERFAKHLNPKGILLFTSGTERGEAWGKNGGEQLFHASLDTTEYEALLKQNGFTILKHVVNDPDCGGATVWMAKHLG
ncbi:MAG: class I SAM-dependent methyltransferase [Bacteroidota bacterium]